ncbi:MAG TPA: anthrone oxygenase family protein [Luteimonas sp.]|nr:anthrone oxygenase family protein [Luteimonas sp.]
MRQALLDGLVLLAALGAGLVAGIFFAFSNFVMRALARLPAAQGIAAMQSINVTVLNPLFLGLFVGTALLCAVLAGYGALHVTQPGSVWMIAGGLSYLLGNLAVTRICNIPRNEALARLSPVSAEAESAWREYLSGWNFWNHVRTVTAFVASAAFWLAR